MHAISLRRLALIASSALLPLATTLAAEQPAKPEPSVALLLERPDLRPARVSAGKDFNFGGGESIRAGTELGVHDIRRDAIVLDTGGFIFEARIEDTDLLERTRALIHTLSPEAIALTQREVARDNTLWPARVSNTVAMRFADNTEVPAGSVLSVRAFDGNQLTLHHAPTDALFRLEPADTDMLARARARVDTPKENRRPFFVRSIEAAMVADDAPPQPALAEAEYLLIYRGRKECPRCTRFTPDLLKSYEKLRTDHDNFEVVFVAQDRSQSLHDEHVRDKAMLWTVLPFNKRFATAAADLDGTLLPIVYLMKPDGTVLDRTAPDGQGRSAKDVLKRLERELR